MGVIGSILREAIGIEKVVAVRLRPHSPEWGNLIWFARQFEIEAVHQFVIRQGLNTNRESSLKSGDSGKRPTVEHLARGAAVMTQRQFPVIAEHDAVSRIEIREGPAATGINRVQDPLEAGSFIEGFAERVSSGELEAVRKALIERCL